MNNRPRKLCKVCKATLTRDPKGICIACQRKRGVPIKDKPGKMHINEGLSRVIENRHKF